MEERSKDMFSFENISFDVSLKRDRSKKNDATDANAAKKVVLDRVSGHVSSSEILGIIGQSGAGKTSLLNAITDRTYAYKKDCNISRNARFNATPLNKDNFFEYGSYVMQDDALLEHLTPRESLHFVSKLKLKQISKEERERRINELLQTLGLVSFADRKIGSISLGGISGGERKRTSIAYEIVSDPKILILDEPTSGIDSHNSLILFKYLRKLCAKGKLIVVSLNQPSSLLYEYIDKVMILKEGTNLYFGSLQESIPYMENASGYKMELYFNMFEYLINASLKCDLKRSNTINYDVEAEINNFILSQKTKVIDSSIHHDRVANLRTDFYEVFLLLKRSITCNLRDKNLFLSRLSNILVNSLIMMSFYYNFGVEKDHTKLLINFTGYVFNTVNNFFINGMYTAIYSLPNTLKILTREYPSRFYNIRSFFYALVLLYIIQTAIYSCIYTMIMHYSCGLDLSLSQLIVQLITNFLNYFLGVAFGVLMSFVIPGPAIFPIVPWIFIIFMLGSGYYLDNNNFPLIFKWINCISPYKYLTGINYRLNLGKSHNLEYFFEQAGYEKMSMCFLVIIIYILGVLYLAYRALLRKFKPLQ